MSEVTKRCFVESCHSQIEQLSEGAVVAAGIRVSLHLAALTITEIGVELEYMSNDVSSH